MLQNPHILLTFDNVQNPLRLPRKTTAERLKVLQARQFFTRLTSKCASRHNCLHFFDISTFKSALSIVCVLYILPWKCASRHNGIHFFDMQLPKVVREWCALCILTAKCASRHNVNPQKWSENWCVLHILTSKCASRHNGVQLFISYLARWLCTRRFSEPTFRPSGATNHLKNTVFRIFSNFSRTCIFFLLTLSLLWSSLFCSSLLWLFSPLLFHLSILSEIWLLNFLRSYPKDAHDIPIKSRMAYGEHHQPNWSNLSGSTVKSGLQRVGLAAPHHRASSAAKANGLESRGRWTPDKHKLWLYDTHSKHPRR